METFLFIRNNYSVDSMCFWRGWVSGFWGTHKEYDEIDASMI
jgi:mRNA-degrading endonuclease HigB of HigAB toxin-antitoxin module